MTNYAVEKELDEVWDMLTENERKRLLAFHNEAEAGLSFYFHCRRWNELTAWRKSQLRTAFVRTGLAKEMGYQP